MSIESHWRHLSPLSLALLPASFLFRGLVAARRAAYAMGLLRSRRIRVPVVVVGNVTVGGTGKTPLVLWLAALLLAHGRRPGIVSRGYGSGSDDVRAVEASSDASSVGDEPLLLARRSGCPVWIGADRVAAANALLAANPACDVVISDDGLQHYRLARDVEIAVIDGVRGLGNGFMLPAGPLREPRARLASVDAVVVNGDSAQHWPNAYSMRLHGATFFNVAHAGQPAAPDDFADKRVAAIAGIGNPARFFAHLDGLGVKHEARAFPDHHAFTARDLDIPGVDAILMTEKDAVKCAAFASERMWVLPVEATPDPALGDLILRKLDIPR